MATFTVGPRVTKVTAADLSAKKYYLAKTNSSGNLVLAAAATDDILGVIADGGRQSGDVADVELINAQGTFKVILGGNVSKGDYLTTDSAGKAIATTTSGNRVFGRAQAAGSTGDVIEFTHYNEKY